MKNEKMIISFDEFNKLNEEKPMVYNKLIEGNESPVPEKTIDSYSGDDVAIKLFQILNRLSELEGGMEMLKNKKQDDEKDDEDVRPQTKTAGDNWHPHTHWRNLDLDTPKKRPYGDQHYHTSWRNLDLDTPTEKPKNYQHPHTHWRNLEEDGDL
jgi:hypothetical protein